MSRPLPAPVPTPAAGARTLRFRDWATVRYGLVWAYEGPVLPAARVGTYTNPDLSCWLVRRGHVILTTAGRAVTAREGDWAFVASPTRHQAFSRDAEILSLHVHFSWPGGEPVIEQKHNRVVPARDHPRLEKSALTLVRIVRRHFPRASAFLPDESCTLPLYLEVQNRLPLWLAAYLEAQAALGVHPRRLGLADDRVLQALADLDRQPLDRKFSERDWVARARLGRSQLNALFVHATGVTPRRYFERRRLETARRLLTHTRMSIKEIGIDLGFRHESHFSQWFHRREGRPPRRFRESAG